MPYPDDLCRKLEAAHTKLSAAISSAIEEEEDAPESVRVRTDDERYVELLPKGRGVEKWQVRYDDESKHRPVQRRPAKTKKRPAAKAKAAQAAKKKKRAPSSEEDEEDEDEAPARPRRRYWPQLFFGILAGYPCT